MQFFFQVLGNLRTPMPFHKTQNIDVGFFVKRTRRKGRCRQVLAYGIGGVVGSGKRGEEGGGSAEQLAVEALNANE